MTATPLASLGDAQFYGKRRDALKILFSDGSGMCIFYKRLDRFTFRIPEPVAAGVPYVEIDDATLEVLLDGIEVNAAPGRRPRQPRVH